jgi:hypothetical protein
MREYKKMVLQHYKRNKGEERYKKDKKVAVRHETHEEASEEREVKKQ